jgi:phospho-N-acetylmuramoyl-pentapeptide-transferase
VVAIFFSVVAIVYEAVALNLISAVTLGAMLGFLIYNHHPAKVFMGDTGSLFLGGIVVGSAFLIDEPMIILIAGGIYVFEAVSVILQVFCYKTFHKRIFKCAPVHHHFEAYNWSEVKIVTVFSLTTVLLCVIAWFGL